MGKKARLINRQLRQTRETLPSLTLVEIAEGDKLIWNWAGGTPCTALAIDHKTQRVSILVHPRARNASNFFASVAPSSLSRDPKAPPKPAPVAVPEAVEAESAA